MDIILVVAMTILVPSAFGAGAAATDDAMARLVRESVATSSQALKSENSSSNGWGALTLGYIPIQSMELRYGTRDGDESDSFRLRQRDVQSETYALRLHMKSLSEILATRSSAELTQQLTQLTRREWNNDSLYNAYSEMVERIFAEYRAQLVKDLLGDEKKRNQRAQQMLSQAKADLKDLVARLKQTQRVEYETAVTSSAKSESAKPAPLKLEGKALNEIVNRMMDGVGPLKDQALKSGPRETLWAQRAKTEMGLERIQRDVRWAEDTKWVRYVDLRRDSLQKENSFVVAFNVPFLRFDGATRDRERAVLQAKELRVERDLAKENRDLSMLRAELERTSAQVEITRARLIKSRGIIPHVQALRQVDLSVTLESLVIELELDQLDSTEKFYKSYLDYLHVTGRFAADPTRNYLDQAWGSL